MNPSNSRSQPHTQQRRSQRILLSVPILVSGQHANGSPFSERTKTQVVNPHGALIRLREPVLTGQKLRIKQSGYQRRGGLHGSGHQLRVHGYSRSWRRLLKALPKFLACILSTGGLEPEKPRGQTGSSVTIPAKPIIVK